MICPKCQAQTRSIHTTRFTDGTRRRRECVNPECRYRFNSAEVVYGKAFAACRGKRLVLLHDEHGEPLWTTAKSLREVAMLKLRQKRAAMTPEQREEQIRKMLFGDSGRLKPVGIGEDEDTEVPGVADDRPPWHDDDVTDENDNG